MLMRISNIVIKNYRNIQSVDVRLNNSTALIGDNNSGKSNILKAITLPFLSDDIGYTGKNLSWSDINNEEKSKYFQYLLNNRKEIKDGSFDLDDFTDALPKVIVEVTLEPETEEAYFVRNLASEINEDGKICYQIRYEYFPKNVEDVVARVKEVFKLREIARKDTDNIESIKMNLLPMDLYSYSIMVPYKGSSVSYDDLKLFKYTALIAERDDFSRSSNKLGSKSLIKLLQMKLDTASKLKVEEEYTSFFDTLKDLGEMENILNWQKNSDIPNAKDFFEKISILPNMPNMSSLLSSVKLGYVNENLSTQGLGHRNLILILVLLNSLIEREKDSALSLITLEEPEAHLGISNKHLISSYINSFAKNDNSVQLVYSTHSTEFINKIDFNNIIVVSDGQAVSLSNNLTETEKDYLSKNPNLDLYNFFLSKKCILVEGPSEELLIRSYISSKNMLSDIVVISFHKGFRGILNIWLKLNKGSKNRLGIVRDSDGQEKAKMAHEDYNQFENILVSTTKEYTLEPEIVNTEGNYKILKPYFEETFNWVIKSKENIADQWTQAKASVMLRVCQDIASGHLSELVLPTHIKEIIDFLSSTENGGLGIDN